MNILFIGGGNMAEAIISAILGKKLYNSGAIWVSDLKDDRRQLLMNRYQVNVIDSNAVALNKGDVVVLAVKPQDLEAVINELKGKLRPSQLVISIIAGVKIENLSKGLAHKSIVRVMPNTPAMVGLGMSVWTTSSDVTLSQRELTASLLSAMGKELHVEDEMYIDMATAISGSGPAYLFNFVEALTEAAISIGFSHEVARKLVVQTIVGSCIYLEQSSKDASDLRRMVTSRGGTTEAALEKLSEADFNSLILSAVKAAYHRAKELGH
jgi:pyrroline-5-carboxylate reductase